jgi:hypothetical protein
VARGAVVQSSWSATHLLVGRAVAFVGGLVPGIGEVVALVVGPLPGVVHGKAGDPLTLGFLDHLLGEVGPLREVV